MNVKLVFIIIGVLLQTTLVAQRQFSGTILDAKNKQSLPYVNIGILNKGTGTVTNEQGIFSLLLEGKNIAPTDTLQISSIGYKVITLIVDEIDFSSTEDDIILMEPFVEQLNEVVVTNKGYVPIMESVGYRNQGEDNYGYWKDSIALGGELATKILVNKKRRKLNMFEFEIVKNSSDSLLIRVNFYDKDGRLDLPHSNLNKSKTSILHTLRKDDMIVKIDVSPYNICGR